jgi:hypothetical protein
MKSNESLWYRTNNRTHAKSIITEIEMNGSRTNEEYIFYTEDGKILEDSRIVMDRLKKLLKAKKIKITSKKISRYKAFALRVEYIYLDQSLGTYTFDKVDLNRTGDTILLNEDIIDYIIEHITEKHSGINLSYYKKKNVIEFRYLSSDILGNVDEFLEFINYFLFVPHVAMRAKRVKLGKMELRKMDNNKIQIKL